MSMLCAGNLELLLKGRPASQTGAIQHSMQGSSTPHPEFLQLHAVTVHGCLLTLAHRWTGGHFGNRMLHGDTASHARCSFCAERAA